MGKQAVAVDDTEARIAGFIAAYDARMIEEIADCRRRMQALFPRGIEFVYDNYNSLVFGYGPNERASEAVLSLACFPRWVTLCLLWGVKLPDPKGLLKGEGKQVRSLRLAEPADLENADVLALIRAAIQPSEAALSAAPPLRTVIRAVSVKQRARRPGR
ncbi:DUF1801 domain-containing protein [Pelomonas sp. SE-A7]|uniref:DUF1801 domain-containing protein n=1 Tax=Pelomonas sp. SE-A7 TaxID=3054953 RepID=UPI00259CE672|nr:DUF1801 domain-containing protein [Pelomonas sp. SE-A7]MDM4764750.1 DUF1801 domain-containing protein [Pelomonas sp. SE-A7]